MISQLGSSLAIAVLAAVAVHFGFGAAFVDDAIGLPVAVYVCGLAAFLARSVPGMQRAIRAGVAAVVGGLTVWALRTVLRFELPFGQFVTTGHSPFVALPCAALVAELVNIGVAALTRRKQRAEQPRSDAGA